MKPLQRGIVLGVLQCLLVLSVAGKYAWDRERLPRAWVRTGPIDPNLPLRGRYVSLQLEVAFAPPEGAGNQAAGYYRADLFAENGVLKGRANAEHGAAMITGGPHPMLLEAVAYFLPEHAGDPTRLQPGEELWAEVSVPASGPPRPVRLGIKRNGVLSPIEVR